jgi:hypothetical protein
MSEKAGQNVMAILPDRLDHHQRRGGRDAAEHFHSALLAIDKAVAFGRVAGMTAFDGATQLPDGAHDGFFGARLGRPTFLVGSQAQIAARN